MNGITERDGGRGASADVRGRGRRGFTLIEVVGAFVIFAAGVLMTASLAGSLSVQVQDAAVRAAVVSSTQERMEEMESMDYESITTGTSVESLSIMGEEYHRSTVVSNYGTRILSVVVTVEPAGGASGPAHTLLSYAYDPW